MSGFFNSSHKRPFYFNYPLKDLGFGISNKKHKGPLKEDNPF